MKTFIIFKTTLAGFDWVWNAGDVIDTRDDPQYWAHWVSNGTAEYINDPAYTSKAIRVRTNTSQANPIIRPIKCLDNLSGNSIRLNLPEDGAFNAGLAPYREEYCMIYRPTETSFKGCVLNKKFEPYHFHEFKTTNCADPRMITLGPNIYIFYSSFNDPSTLDKECIRGQLVMESNCWVDYEPFRVSPEHLPRQKNWMPFVYEGGLFFVSDVCPHTIYEWKAGVAEKVYETDWIHPWFYKSQLRGNCNIVRLDSGDYLATFHTAEKIRGCTYYDNGFYIFEGKPPFKVLKASNKSYLSAETATEPPFRKKDVIKCNFPVGLVVEGERVLISYGDSDSCVKIMETTLTEMNQLLVPVY